MKKLIAISVVFALVAGVAFAVDLAGTVAGGVSVITADSAGNVGAGGEWKVVRLEGSGEVADGKFGGWIRLDPAGGTWDSFGNMAGIAWWKPIDQLKLSIGSNPDGHWGKEGNSGWAFYQTTNDSTVVDNSNTWGGGLGGDLMTRSKPWDPNYCGAFFGGWGDQRLSIEISPVDMVGINIAIPFFNGGDIKDVFLGTVAQVDLNLSFGNFAFTYVGSGDAGDFKQSEVFGFFSLTAIDNLQLDFGLGSNFVDTDQIKLGFALKYGTDSWGIKFRSMFAIPTRSTQAFGMFFDVLPYFVINESFRAFVSAGMNIASIKDGNVGGAGWHVNPYIEVGEEWGPKFVAGIRVWAAGFDSPTVNLAVPIGLIVSF